MSTGSGWSSRHTETKANQSPCRDSGPGHSSGGGRFHVKRRGSHEHGRGRPWLRAAGRGQGIPGTWETPSCRRRRRTFSRGEAAPLGLRRVGRACPPLSPSKVPAVGATGRRGLPALPAHHKRERRCARRSVFGVITTTRAEPSTRSSRPTSGRVERCPQRAYSSRRRVAQPSRPVRRRAGETPASRAYPRPATFPVLRWELPW
jgi:hypothetical protein